MQIDKLIARFAWALMLKSLAAVFVCASMLLAVLGSAAKADAGDVAPNAPATRPAATGSGLPPLKVRGRDLVADGSVIRLRGLDWGWWHLMGTRYSEADMQHVAQWGANVVRLSFSYNDLETDDTPVAWKEGGFKDLDEVVQWGKRYGIYIILDMHVVPGGQSTAPYCAGGYNLLWTDTTSQDRFVALWTEIARRYRTRPEVAAYELLNEPGSEQKTPDLLRRIDQRVIDAIRRVDPDKIIVVGGDRGSGPADLTERMKFADANILYTFHWYVGAGGNEDWISTATQDHGLAGDQDWTRIEYTCTAPAGADHMSALLRSGGNSGSAWFDDVDVEDASGDTVQSSSFDHDAQGYKPEAPSKTMDFDPHTGHAGAGSLRLHQTLGKYDWAGWSGPRFSIQPGKQYKVSAWVKLGDATGSTYLGAMFFRSDTQLDRDQFEKKIAPAVDFATRFDVPVWVGEFGCDASNRDLQVEWVNACISLFENNGFDWTYWNDRETSNPNGMGLHAEHRDGSDYPVNQRLLATLQEGWSLTRRAAPNR